MIDLKKKLLAFGLLSFIVASISACSPQKEAINALEQAAFDNAISGNAQNLKNMEMARTAFAESTNIENALIQRTLNYAIKDTSKRIGVYSSKPALFVNMSLTNPHDSAVHLIDVYLLIEHKGKISRATFRRSHFRNPKPGKTGTQEYTLLLEEIGFTDRNGYGASEDFELSDEANDYSITGYPVRITLTKNWEEIEFLDNGNDLNGFMDMSRVLQRCNQELNLNNEIIQTLSKKGIKPSNGNSLPKFPNQC